MIGCVAMDNGESSWDLKLEIFCLSVPGLRLLTNRCVHVEKSPLNHKPEASL